MEIVLQEIISNCNGCILYIPRKEEVNFKSPDFPIKISQNKHSLPANKDSDPFTLAAQFSNKLFGKKVYLLIPGTKFDKYGTRHGRGGGWYDRFLSRVPREWIRIGVTEVENFSNRKITKKEWDELMDWVIVKQKNNWNIVKVVK